MARSQSRSASRGQLRIIGGQWRGRKLQFNAEPGLRPTADRVRETLFNWLAPVIHGARCLDLFAGSGALGLEALSRGASHCDFVDASARASATIAQHLDTLQATARGRAHTLTAEHFLPACHAGFDIVFLDPPFGAALAAPAMQTLSQNNLLNPGGFVYLETGADEEAIALPENWHTHRDKTAGGVRYQLLAID
jgi:16S rRNA (guanine966-N2)-methyltransferase